MAETDNTSRLFQYIERLQGGRPWGQLLDAGTGENSLRWISRLGAEGWTAVTASTLMAKEVASVCAEQASGSGQVVIGNWTDPELLAGRTFDTVLADYLLGAIDGFAPYWQEMLFERLLPHLRPGGRLYVTGLEPYVPFPATTEAGSLVREIGCLRDACLLLAGERPYREFPVQWVLRKLLQSGFNVLDAKHFPIKYSASFVTAQLAMCEDRSQRFASAGLADTMRQHIASLRARALHHCEQHGGLSHGADYVVVAEPLQADSY